MTDQHPEPDEDEIRLRLAEQITGANFRDRSLLRQALTHASSTASKSEDNERLEFLGDAVLDLIVREYLFLHYPEAREGEMTEGKSVVVCKDVLASAGKKLGLGECLFVGRGVFETLPDSLLANGFEALVAALYLDGGYEQARSFVLSALGERFAPAMAERVNCKSALQEWMQKKSNTVPEYRVVASSGPDHDKQFEVAVFDSRTEIGRGTGRSKKEAEAEAARDALAKMDICTKNAGNAESGAGEEKAK